MSQTYFQGYESGTPASEPAGIDKNTTDFLPVVDTTNVFAGSQNCKMLKNVLAVTSIHYIFRDTTVIPPNGDGIVQGVFNLESVNLRGGPAFRGNNSTTDEAYVMMLRATTTFRFSSISGTTETVKTTITISAFSAATQYHIAVRMTGERIQGKYWADGGAEPDWTASTIDTTDTTFNKENRAIGGYYFNGSSSAPDNAYAVWLDNLEAIQQDMSPSGGVAYGGMSY